MFANVKKLGLWPETALCVPLTCAFFSRSVKTENQSGVSASSSKVMMAKANVEPLNCQSWWQAIQCCTCLVHNTAWKPGGIFWSKAGFAVGRQPAPELSPMDEMTWGWPETSRAWNWTGEERGREEERDQNVSHVTSLLSWCLSILFPTSASNMSGHQTSYYSYLTNSQHIIYLWVKLPHFGSSLSSGVCCSVPPGFHGFEFMTVAIENARRWYCRSSFKSSGIFKQWHYRNWKKKIAGIGKHLETVLQNFRGLLLFFTAGHTVESRGPICPIWPKYLSKYFCAVSVRLVHWFAANSCDRNITNSCRDDFLH